MANSTSAYQKFHESFEALGKKVIRAAAIPHGDIEEAALRYLKGKISEEQFDSHVSSALEQLDILGEIAKLAHSAAMEYVAAIKAAAKDEIQRREILKHVESEYTRRVHAAEGYR